MTKASSDSASIELVDPSGVVIGSLTLFARSSLRPAITKIPRSDAIDLAVEETQIVEGQDYEYELSPSTLRLATEGLSGLVSQSSNPSHPNCGSISSSGFLGRLTLVAIDADDGELGRCSLEVVSHKFDYLTHYRQMLEDIVQQSIDLALDAFSPTDVRLTPTAGEDVPTLARQLAFLRTLVFSESFRSAMGRILAAPHQRLYRYQVPHDPRRGVRANAGTLKGLAKAGRRVPVPNSHPLAARLSSLPREISVLRSRDTWDTQENRFVKFALGVFESFVESVHQKLTQMHGEAARRIDREAISVGLALRRYLSSDLFKDVSGLRYFPLSSPALQQKEGYREVLRAWLRFDVATRIAWSAGDDVFGAGQRNVAVLYEYWVFFKLVGIVCNICGQKMPDSKSLMEPTDDGFSLRLKAGRRFSLTGKAYLGGTPLSVRLDYNRTFAVGLDPAFAGSWTLGMRPDYTFTLWPQAVSEEEAEKVDKIIHIHFDAKYRVRWLEELVSSPDGQEELRQDEASDEVRLEALGIYHRGDLLKMHAYKDAVRRSEGAYAIYPGDKAKLWREYVEILPGLGAFALPPGGDTTILEGFLSDITRAAGTRFKAASVEGQDDVA